MQTSAEYWVHDLSPFLIRFPENPIGLEGIRYYGLAYMLGFLAAWWLLKVYDQRGKFRISADARANLMTAIIIGVLAGGRLGYMLLYDLEAFLSNPLILFRVDQGGMASHGGFVGIIVALYWFSRKQDCKFLDLSDVIVTIGPLGLFLGRIANFINGELWGRVTHLSWAVIFPDSPKAFNESTMLYGPEPRHPSQLYEAALEGAFIFGYLQWRYWKARPPVGQLAGEFLLGYGVARIVCESFREPDATLILGLSRGQFYSIFMVIAGLAIIRYTRQQAKRIATA
ncbi:MAG: prolipoprotein diacylglyceryl transferase [Verrucomicrobiota bacterium]